MTPSQAASPGPLADDPAPASGAVPVDPVSDLVGASRCVTASPAYCLDSGPLNVQVLPAPSQRDGEAGQDLPVGDAVGVGTVLGMEQHHDYAALHLEASAAAQLRITNNGTAVAT
jgi:hypothetical protein